MAMKRYKPTSSGRRQRADVVTEGLSEGRPLKSLTKGKKGSVGRSRGRVTIRHREQGAKKLYRRIDFRRDKKDIEGRVASLEYDPNRTANIALIVYPDGEKRYILAPEGLNVGQVVESGPAVEPKVGNTLPLYAIPVGVEVHNIEMNAGQGGKLVRTAGGTARLMAKKGDWATLILPSGETRIIRRECRATVGQLSNSDYQNVSIGKAGRSRHMGHRPHVRGKAQNPVAHPMGGGEGRSNGGRHPCSPTGVLAKGGKTRNPRSVSNSKIIRRRKNSRGIQLMI